MTKLGLSIIIVNWNTRDLLVGCLERLKPIQDQVDVIVVDNASFDKSADAVSEYFSWARLIRNQENIGYAAANNQGWEVAREENILLLNSDTIPDTDSICSMVDFLDKNSEVGVIGPFLRLGNNKAQVGAAGWELSLSSAFFYQSMLHRIFPKLFKGFYLHQPAFQGANSIMVDWVSGAAMMLRSNIYKEVGGIPEQYFMYAEDIDFCRKIKLLGYKIAYLPDVEIVHLHGASSDNASEISTRWLVSTFRYYRELHGVFSTRILAAMFVMGSLMRIVISLISIVFNRHQFSDQIKRHGAYLKAAISVVVSTESSKKFN